MYRSSSVLLLFCIAIFPLSCISATGEREPTKGNSGGSDSVIEASTGGSDAGAGSSTNGSGGEVKNQEPSGGSSDGSSGGTTTTSVKDDVCGGVFTGLEDCGSAATKAETVPVNILLVLDKSGSMDDIPAGEETTLWGSTKNALWNTLAAAPNAVSFGLQLFPSSSVGASCGAAGTCCDMPEAGGVSVPISAGFDTRQAIVDLLDNTQPGGGTPAALALAQAFDYFNTGAGKDLEGERFVLFATDGGPNCNMALTCEADACTTSIDIEKYPECARKNCCEDYNDECLDDAGTVDSIEALKTIGVGTFVVGLAGSEVYASQLDSFAVAGGHPRKDSGQSYFRVDAEGSAAGLSDVLNEITHNLLQTCSMQLGWNSHLTSLNVAVDCNIVPRATAGVDLPEGDGTGDSTSYWVLDEESELPTIRLHGAICEKIEMIGVQRIDVLADCPTVVIR